MRTKPKIEIDLAQVEAAASRGLTNEQIALALGISHQTLYTRKKENLDFLEAIKKGRAKGVLEISNKLYELAKASNLGAICFFLKCKGEFREKMDVDITQKQDKSLDLSKLSKEDLQIIENILKKYDKGVLFE